jgi:membrane protein
VILLGDVSATPASVPAAASSRRAWGNAWTILRRHVRENQLALRASSLTYATLLSVVPFLAVIVSVLHAFDLEELVLPWLVDRLRLGGDEAAQVILDAVRRLDATALGVFGGVLLLVSALVLIAQVDAAFNVVWGVRENRPLTTRLLGYGGLLVIAPLWIAVWTTMVGSARLALATLPGGQTLAPTLVRVASLLLGFLVLAALYFVTPNTRVRVASAAAGAFVALVLLEAAQWVFVFWVKTSAGYDALYGALAALPIFLGWVYANWMCILLGAEAGYLVQNVPAWLREAGEPGHLAWDERERLVLASAALIAAGHGRETEEIAELLGVSPRLLQRPLDDLMDGGWIEAKVDAHGQITAFRPGPHLGRAPIAEIRRSLRVLGEESGSGPRRRALRTEPQWMRVFAPLEQEGDRPYEAWTSMELAERLRPLLPAKPPDA